MENPHTASGRVWPALKATFAAPGFRACSRPGRANSRWGAHATHSKGYSTRAWRAAAGRGRCSRTGAREARPAPRGCPIAGRRLCPAGTGHAADGSVRGGRRARHRGRPGLRSSSRHRWLPASYRGAELVLAKGLPNGCQPSSPRVHTVLLLPATSSRAQL